MNVYIFVSYLVHLNNYVQRENNKGKLYRTLPLRPHDDHSCGYPIQHGYTILAHSPNLCTQRCPSILYRFLVRKLLLILLQVLCARISTPFDGTQPLHHLRPKNRHILSPIVNCNKFPPCLRIDLIHRQV